MKWKKPCECGHARGSHEKRGTGFHDGRCLHADCDCVGVVWSNDHLDLHIVKRRLRGHSFYKGRSPNRKVRAQMKHDEYFDCGSGKRRCTYPHGGYQRRAR